MMHKTIDLKPIKLPIQTLIDKCIDRPSLVSPEFMQMLIKAGLEEKKIIDKLLIKQIKDENDISN
jgi:hypothetical protein